MHDDFLNSLHSMGIAIHQENPSTTSSANINASPDASAQEEPITAEAEESQLSTNLSDNDFNEILNANGFTGEEESSEDDLETMLDNFEEETQEVHSPEIDAEGFSDQEFQVHTGEGLLAQIEATPVIDTITAEDILEAARRFAETLDTTEERANTESPEEGAAAIQQMAESSEANVARRRARRSQPQDERTIPQNSPSLLVDEYTSRFSGTAWYDEIRSKNVIIAGQGGIGSNVSFQIARMAPTSMVLYDDDVVEAVNMAGQLYRKDDVGRPKVEAIASMIEAYTSAHSVYAINSKFNADSEASNIMICGFDNMRARRLFFNKWKEHVLALPEEERYKCLMLDGRLSIDILQVLCVTGNDPYNIARYEREFLFSDAEAEHTVCSMKQTTYLACMIGSVMTNLFVNFTANLLNPVIPYDLPFFTEYDSQNMIFKTEM